MKIISFIFYNVGDAFHLLQENAESYRTYLSFQHVQGIIKRNENKLWLLLCAKFNEQRVRCVCCVFVSKLMTQCGWNCLQCQF